MSRRIDLIPELGAASAVTAELTITQNDAAVATVLRWAQRHSADKAAVEDLWSALGLDADGAFERARELGRSRTSRVRGEVITLLDQALQECLTEFCHPNEFGGYDTDSRAAAGIVVDTLLANGDLLAELVGSTR